MNPGPANESGQGLTFTVITDNDALFSVLPAVNPTTGDLTYTTAAGANGEAGVDVTLKDDGGTANGGVDSSVPQSFLITVNETIADISVDKVVTDRNPDVGDEVVFTISVTNLGPDDATGIQVTDQLPAGLSYLGNDSGGFYDPETGIWNVGDLRNSESDSFHITAKVEQKGSITNTATVTSSSPHDPDPGNDSDDAVLNAGGKAMPWLLLLLLGG